MFLHNMCSYT